MNESTTAVQSYIKELMDLVTRLIVKPADFFRTMPKDGGLLDPLLFLVVTAVLDVLVLAAGSAVKRGVGLHDLGMLVGGLVAAPLIAVILSFFAAGVLFAIWAFMGSRENYETSYRCLAYTQILCPITILFSFVPYLGLLGIAWWLYLMVTASTVVHKLQAQVAALVFGVVAAVSGLVYYKSVTSGIEEKQRLQAYTKKLQEMPTTSDLIKPGR